jgi:hypothetical protein
MANPVAILSAPMMTLGNMRHQGVRTLAIYCGALHCHHQAVLDISNFADDVTVPTFGARMCAPYAALSVRTRGPIGMSVRLSVCLASFVPLKYLSDRPTHGYRRERYGD